MPSPKAQRLWLATQHTQLRGGASHLVQTTLCGSVCAVACASDHANALRCTAGGFNVYAGACCTCQLPLRSCSAACRVARRD